MMSGRDVDVVITATGYHHACPFLELLCSPLSSQIADVVAEQGSKVRVELEWRNTFLSLRAVTDMSSR